MPALVVKRNPSFLSAVRSLLAAIYEIDPARLQALGRGKSELKDKTRPEDGINRRVEIRNVTN